MEARAFRSGIQCISVPGEGRVFRDEHGSRSHTDIAGWFCALNALNAIELPSGEISAPPGRTAVVAISRTLAGSSTDTSFREGP